MKITYRKLKTGNYLGRSGSYYIFIRKRDHGKWDGFDKRVWWYTAYIGKGGEWLFSQGVHTSFLKTIKIAKDWVETTLLDSVVIKNEINK